MHPVGFLSICGKALLLRKHSLRCGVPSTQELSGREEGDLACPGTPLGAAVARVQVAGVQASGSLLQPLDFLFKKKKNNFYLAASGLTCGMALEIFSCKFLGRLLVALGSTRDRTGHPAGS